MQKAEGPALSRDELVVLVREAVRGIVEHTPMTEDQAIKGLDLAFEMDRAKVMLYEDAAVVVFDVDQVLASIERKKLKLLARAPWN